MISVEDARARIISALKPVESETVALEEAAGRVLAEDARAKSDQPPFPVSMMDGYALRAADRGPRHITGSAPAGHPFLGTVGPGETVRLFTGSVVPEGADAVLAQEDAEAQGEHVTFTETPHPGKFIRARALDFAQGSVLAAKGKCLSARDLALLAAGDIARISVRRRLF